MTVSPNAYNGKADRRASNGGQDNFARSEACSIAGNERDTSLSQRRPGDADGRALLSAKR